MQKLENYTLQKFLDKLIEELKREKEYNRLKNDQLDIPFIISAMYQSFKNNTEKYKDFISDLDKYSDYGLYVEDSQNDYNGLIDIFPSTFDSILCFIQPNISQDVPCI